MSYFRGLVSSLLAAFVLALGMNSALAQSMPGKGVTIQPVEGTNLEEKFQHEIIYRALEQLGLRDRRGAGGRIPDHPSCTRYR